MKTFRSVLFMFRYSWRVSKKIFVAAAMRIILNSAEPFIYLIFPSMIIDELTGGRSWNRILMYIGLFAASVAVLRVIGLVCRVFSSTAINGSDVRNACLYARHFAIMPYYNLEDEKIRDMQQKVLQNVRANGFVFDYMTGIVTEFVKLAGFAYIITTLNPLVLLFIIVFTALDLITDNAVKKNEYNFQPMLANSTRKFNYLFDTMTNFEYAKEVRVNQAKKLLSGKFDEVLRSFIKNNKKYLGKGMRIGILSRCLSLVKMALLYGYVAIRAISGTISAGGFNLYIGAVYNISDSLSGVVRSAVGLRYLSKYVDDYHNYIEAAFPDVSEKEVAEVPPEREGVPVLEFDNVCFTYPNTERQILNNISVKIRKGEKLSVVGMNGAGKTTFIKLICRLYEPTSGTIKLNGVDISTIKREEYSKQLSVVFQDFKIFSFSFADNVVLNLPYDEEKFKKSTEDADLVSRLESLPMGKDTSIYKDFDENGVELSGGEGQKLATARAYYKDAPLVILDEPTAALDAMAESEVYRKFGEITAGKTAIFISHRLASTRFCDRIAVFDGGTISEYGSHDELMALGKLYAEMYAEQAKYYVEERSNA